MPEPSDPSIDPRGASTRERVPMTKATLEAFQYTARRDLLWSMLRPLTHALSNPLQGALGNVELLGLELDAGASDQRALRRGVELARSEILHAAELVGALQAFARGRMDVNACWDGVWVGTRSIVDKLSHHGSVSLTRGPLPTTRLAASEAALQVVWVGVVEATRHAKARSLDLQWHAREVFCVLEGHHDGEEPALLESVRALAEGTGMSWESDAEPGLWRLSCPVLV